MVDRKVYKKQTLSLIMQKSVLISVFFLSVLVVTLATVTALYGSVGSDTSASTSTGANANTQASANASSSTSTTTSSGSTSSNTNSGLGVGIALDSGVQVDSGITVQTTGSSTKVILSNGNEATLKVTSNEAKQTAQANLNVSDCSSCTVELSEVKAQLAYKVTTKKQAKVLGFIKTNMDVTANVNAETNQLISIQKPWWSFLAVESQTSASASSTTNAYAK